MKSLNELYNEIQEAQVYAKGNMDYQSRMLHRIPDAPVVDRTEVFKEFCKGKVILDIGCTGPMHAELKKVSREVWGIDVNVEPGERYFRYNLDSGGLPLTIKDKFDLIVCGEVLEHLTNPGNFLSALREADCGVLVSVPNAHSEVGKNHIDRGVENVNLDHVSYYSYWTLRRLVEKCGYEVLDFYWWDERRKGKPQHSEGIIFLIRPVR